MTTDMIDPLVEPPESFEMIDSSRKVGTTIMKWMNSRANRSNQPPK